MPKRVIKTYPSRLNQIAISKTEPGDENNQDISSLVGKVDIRKLEDFAQNDPDAYSFSGGLCRSNQGIMEFVEMFKAPIKVLHPLLTATQEGNYNSTEGLSSIPFEGIILAHSNESEWQSFKNLTHIDISEADATTQAMDDMDVFINILRSKDYFPEFDSYPETAKMGLLDLAYNAGPRRTRDEYKRTTAAVRRRNWKQAGIEQRDGRKAFRANIAQAWFNQAAQKEHFFISHKNCDKRLRQLLTM